RPPPGASRSRPRAGPHICLGRAGDACVVGALERAGDTLYGARVYVKLGRRLAHVHAARQCRPDSLSRNRGGQSVGTVRGFRSPRRPGRRTQRIKARLLFVFAARSPEGGGGRATGSQSYIPPDPKDDKALHTALDLIRGVQKNPAYPAHPKTAVLN